MLARNYRFHGRSSLGYVFRKGKSVKGRYLILRCVENKRQKTSRMAVVVSRKTAKRAVVRNRVRRRLYESVRLRAGLDDVASHDLVFIVLSADIAECPYVELEREVMRLLHKVGLPGETAHHLRTITHL